MSLSEQQAAALSPDTVVVAAGRPPRERDQPVNPPIVLSSTYFGTGPLADGDRGYGRYSNPTWDPFEEALGQLEGSDLPGPALRVRPGSGQFGVVADPRRWRAGDAHPQLLGHPGDGCRTGAEGLHRTPHRGHRGHGGRDRGAGPCRTGRPPGQHAVAGKPHQPDARHRRDLRPGRRRPPGRCHRGHGQHLFHALGAAAPEPGVRRRPPLGDQIPGRPFGRRPRRPGDLQPGAPGHAAAPPDHPRRHRRAVRSLAGPARPAHPGAAD